MPSGLNPNDVCYTYRTLLSVPVYLVQSIGDSGVHRVEDRAGQLVDQDDLRLHLELSGGHVMLLPGKCRLLLDAEYVHVQVPVEVKQTG